MKTMKKTEPRGLAKGAAIRPLIAALRAAI
jgi:hypothetical protein